MASSYFVWHFEKTFCFSIKNKNKKWSLWFPIIQTAQRFSFFDDVKRFWNFFAEIKIPTWRQCIWRLFLFPHFYLTVLYFLFFLKRSFLQQQKHRNNKTCLSRLHRYGSDVRTNKMIMMAIMVLNVITDNVIIDPSPKF